MSNMVKSIFTGKRVIFIGPLYKVNKNLENFDYVVRTNGFFSIKCEQTSQNFRTNKTHQTRCDILLVNGLYTRTNLPTILANFDKLKYLMTSSCRAFKILERVLTKKQFRKVRLLYTSNGKRKYNVVGYPLMLTFLLYYLDKYQKPKEFHITGIDFYKSKTHWLPGYQSKTGKRLLQKDIKKHNIDSNINVLKRFYKDYGWIHCDKLLIRLLRLKRS